MPRRAIYYDTETTGLRADKDRIIEIAAYDPVNNRTFEKLINPGCPIPREASSIHNISDEMVAKAPAFDTIASEFVEFCGENAVLIAHNNDAFDRLFLGAEFERNKVSMPAWHFLDTLKWARRYRSDLPRHTLQFLREIYGIKANNAHRALDDVIVLHQVFVCMTDDLPIDQICDLLSRPRDIPVREISTMPFGKHVGVPLIDLPKHYVKWLFGSGALDKPENQSLKMALSQLK